MSDGLLSEPSVQLPKGRCTVLEDDDDGCESTTMDIELLMLPPVVVLIFQSRVEARDEGPQSSC